MQGTLQTRLDGKLEGQAVQDVERSGKNSRPEGKNSLHGDGSCGREANLPHLKTVQF
jgi:hypothetical protein